MLIVDDCYASKPSTRTPTMAEIVDGTLTNKQLIQFVQDSYDLVKKKKIKLLRAKSFFLNVNKFI